MENNELEKTFLEVNKTIKYEVVHNNKKVIGGADLGYSNDKTANPNGRNVSTGRREIDYGGDGWNISPPFTMSLLLGKAHRFFYNKNWKKFPIFSGLNNEIGGSAVVNIISNVYVDRNHKRYGKMFAGLEREELSPRYSEIYSQTREGEFHDFLKRNKERKERKISKAEALWEKYVTGDSFSDIISASSESQKEIIFNQTYLRESLLIHGYAGTGKTYVLNELSQKMGGSTNLYPNEIVKSKSAGFFEELGSEDVTCFTFEEYDLKIQKAIKRSMNNIEGFSRKAWFAMFTEESQSIDILPGVKVFVRPVKDMKSKIAIKLEFKRLMNKNVSPEYIKEVLDDLNDYDYEIGQLSKFKEGFIKDSKIKTIAIDEAPLVSEYKYLSGFVQATIDELHYLVSYDKFQHNENRMFEGLKNVETLNEVYRTTKEIFSLATMSVDIHGASVPVSIEDSVTFSERPTFNKVISLSEFCNNHQEYIGNEYLELSIDVDINPNRVKAKYIYILFTRAIAKVNVFGEYKEEVRQWI